MLIKILQVKGKKVCSINFSWLVGFIKSNVSSIQSDVNSFNVLLPCNDKQSFDVTIKGKFLQQEHTAHVEIPPELVNPYFFSFGNFAGSEDPVTYLRNYSC